MSTQMHGIFTTEQVKQFIELHDNGLSWDKISEKAGCNRPTLMNYVRAVQSGGFAESTIQRIRSLNPERLTFKEIQQAHEDKYGVRLCANTVRNALCQYKVDYIKLSSGRK